MSDVTDELRGLIDPQQKAPALDVLLINTIGNLSRRLLDAPEAKRHYVVTRVLEKLIDLFVKRNGGKDK